MIGFVQSCQLSQSYILTVIICGCDVIQIILKKGLLQKRKRSVPISTDKISIYSFGNEFSMNHLVH